MGLFFDIEKGDIGFSFDDKWGMDSEGNMKMKISDHMAMDMNTGDLNLIAGWKKDDDSDQRRNRV